MDTAASTDAHNASTASNKNVAAKNTSTGTATGTEARGPDGTMPAPGTAGTVPSRASSLRSSFGDGTKKPVRGVSFNEDPPDVISRSNTAQSTSSRSARITETSLLRVSSSDDPTVDEIEEVTATSAGIASGNLKDLANVGAVVDSGDDGSDDFNVDQVCSQDLQRTYVTCIFIYVCICV